MLATRLDARRIEYDMSKLRNRESRRSGEGYWGPRMDALLGRNFTAVAFMTETPEQARVVGAALAGARQGRSAGDGQLADRHARRSGSARRSRQTRRARADPRLLTPAGAGGAVRR
jgi:hypothetical protein